MIVNGYIGPMKLEDMRWRRKDPRDWRVERMSAVELVRFVTAVVDDKIFLAQQVHPFQDVDCVFPAIAFLLEVTPDARREIGTFYEFLELSTGHSRNGQPCFTTVRFLHREDWQRARDMIAAEVLRRERLT